MNHGAKGQGPRYKFAPIDGRKFARSRESPRGRLNSVRSRLINTIWPVRASFRWKAPAVKGFLFCSSVPRNQPLFFPLSPFLPPLTSVLPLPVYLFLLSTDSAPSSSPVLSVFLRVSSSPVLSLFSLSLHFDLRFVPITPSLLWFTPVLCSILSFPLHLISLVPPVSPRLLPLISVLSRSVSLLDSDVPLPLASTLSLNFSPSLLSSLLSRVRFELLISICSSPRSHLSLYTHIPAHFVPALLPPPKYAALIRPRNDGLEKWNAR